MNMFKSGDIYRVSYVAKNFTTGLTDVTANRISPAGAVVAVPWSGSNPSAGFCDLGQGVYYYNWTVPTSTGMWTFEVTSASQPALAAVSIQAVDGDTLNDTPFEILATYGTNIESIVNNLPDGGALTSLAQDATAAKEATIGTPVSSVSADIAAVKAVVDASATSAEIVALDDVVDAGFLAGAKEATIGTPVATVSDDIAAVKGDTAAIKLITDVLPDSGALTSLAQDATVAKEATLGTPVSTIAADIAVVGGNVDALTSAVAGISNSTKNTWVGVGSVLIPATGSVEKVVRMTVFDGDGIMEDPDSNQIRVQVYNEANTEITYDVCNDSSSPDPFYMTRTSTGDYVVQYQVASTDVVQLWTFKHTYYEGSNKVVRYGVVDITSSIPTDVTARFDAVDAAIIALDEVVDAGFVAGAKEITLGTPGTGTITGDIANVQTDTTGIKAVTDLLPDAGALTSIAKEATLGAPSVSIAADMTAGFLAGAKEATLGTPAVTVSADIAAVKAETALIYAVTSVLPDAGALASLAQAATLGYPIDTDIATDIANVQAAVDALGSGGYLI